MKTTYLEINRGMTRVPQLKLMEPDDGNVTGFVLALHGFAGSMESFAITGLAERLTKHGTAVLTFNYPGHGTDTDGDLFSLWVCMLDLEHVACYLTEKYPSARWRGVFATSFGGYLALNYLKCIPNTVRIVLRAPAVNMADVFARIVDTEHGGMAQFREKGTVTVGYSHKITVRYSFYEELLAHDVFHTDHAREMLLLHGDCDELVLPADIEEFCGRNPKITRLVIPGGDHRFTKEGTLDQALEAAEQWISL